MPRIHCGVPNVCVASHCGTSLDDPRYHVFGTVVVDKGWQHPFALRVAVLQGSVANQLGEFIVEAGKPLFQPPDVLIDAAV